MNKVLALTHEEDPHAESVCDYLSREGVEIFRVDTDKLIDNYSITFDSRKGKYRISDNKDTIQIDENWCIWNRRVMDPELPKDITEDLEDIVFTETKRMWDGLLFSHKGRVVNMPQANFAANNKIDQLCFAKDYGKRIEIPETVLTNVPATLKEFYEKKRKICHKLQKAALVERNDRYLTTYNNVVDDKNMEQAHLIRRNPSLFQTYIEKKYELRITALEHKIVGIAIHSQDSEQSRVDFRRYDFENVRYEKVDLPKNVEQFCQDMIKHYELSFGEIDMICTNDDRYVFLEINPNGQWLWLELKSNYNLTKDVAENLLL